MRYCLKDLFKPVENELKAIQLEEPEVFQEWTKKKRPEFRPMIQVRPFDVFDSCCFGVNTSTAVRTCFGMVAAATGVKRQRDKIEITDQRMKE